MYLLIVSVHNKKENMKESMLPQDVKLRERDRERRREGGRIEREGGGKIRREGGRDIIKLHFYSIFSHRIEQTKYNISI